MIKRTFIGALTVLLAGLIPFTASAQPAGVSGAALLELQSFIIKGSDGEILDTLVDFTPGNPAWTGSADEDVSLDGTQDELQIANSTTGIDFPPLCLGPDCPAIADNGFPLVSGAPDAVYASADQMEMGAPIANLGAFTTPADVANGAYVEIATGTHEGSANSNNGLEASFVLAADQLQGITFEGVVRAYLEAFVAANEIPPGKSSAAHSFEITITDLTTGIPIFTSRPGPLNQTVSVNANNIPFDVQLSGVHAVGVPTVVPFAVPTPALQAGVPYQLSARITTNVDAARIAPELEPEGCRLTGGGVTSSTLDSGEVVYVWDGTMWTASMPEDENRYQIGGQVGANTGQQPQPKGEWQHHQQRGPFGSFSFHAGTASAPAGSEIIEIRCSDPGGCFPSGNPPSPNKQLDFDCIGTFKNIANGRRAPNWMLPGNVANVTAEGRGNRAFDGTFHYCEVNVDDLGEGPDPAEPDSAACPSEGFGEKGVAVEPANCDCPDFYRITIYNGVDADDVVWLDEDNIDPASLNTTDVLYEVDGYLGRGGNGLQLHKPTGFDTQ